MKIRCFTRLVLLLIISVILSGCVDEQSLINSAKTELTITITEDGCSEKQWVVPSKANISLTIDNQSSITKQWMVMSRPATPPFDADDENRVYVVLDAPVGKSGRNFIAPAMAGEYQVYCGEPGQVDAAVRALLVVVRP